MHRAAALTAVALCCTLAAAASAQAPTRITATAHDDDDMVPGMTLTLSPAAFPKADPGPAEITLFNAGADPHDMVLKRVGGTAKHRYPALEHEESHELDITLKRDSRYKLWCTLPGHRSQGMEATLRVRRR
jgi:hypothetical protein